MLSLALMKSQLASSSALAILFRRRDCDGVKLHPLSYRPRDLLDFGRPLGGELFCRCGCRISDPATRLLHFRQRVFKHLDQPLHIGFEALVCQPDRVSPRERLERLGQSIGARHLGLLHQHRNYVLGEPERRFNFDANEIHTTIETPPP